MNEMTNRTSPTFRKAKNGTWVVFGPAATVRPGTVKVATKAGKIKTVQIDSTGKTFKIGGVDCVYGYIDDTPTPRNHSYPSRTPRGGRRQTCAECGDFFTGEKRCWETGASCYS